MTVQELIEQKRQDASFVDDLQLVLREHGVLDIRIMQPDMALVSRREDKIEFLVDFQDGRTLGDLVGLESELQMLLGYHVSVQTINSLRVRKLNELIAKSVPLN